MNKNQAGFTLIELVMVIVILGVLAAFALPRFADLTGDARTASIQGLAGALKSAAAIAHAQQIADGNSGTTSVTLDGLTVTMNEGYPTADAAGVIVAAAVDAATSGTTTDYIYAITSGTPDTITFTLPSGQSNCQVVYSEGTSSAPYDVATTVTGC